MTTDFDIWYAAWRRERHERQAETRRLLFAALSAGREVTEVAGYGEHAWSASRHCFVPETSADYLTGHLMARHVGFGYDLVIDGERRAP